VICALKGRNVVGNSGISLTKEDVTELMKDAGTPVDLADLGG
jgi:hypothetical protein